VRFRFNAQLRRSVQAGGRQPGAPWLVLSSSQRKEIIMSGSRRDSGDGTRGGPVHGRGSKSVDDNKKSGGGKGQTGGGQDDNATPSGGGPSM
jgi:hypothetical protein